MQGIRPRLVMILSLALMAGCATAPAATTSQSQPAASGGQAQTAPAQERTLNVGVRTEPITASARPLQSVGIKVKFITRLFNASFDLIDDKGSARPYLAEALPQLGTDTWKVNADGTMDTSYHLKPNLTWHDGQPLTADDFVFAWKVFTNPSLGGGASSPPFSLVDNVSAPDPRTVVIHWNKLYPRAGVLQETGTPSNFPPLPQHVLDNAYQKATQDSNWDAFAAQPFWTREFIGAGPYRLTRWDAGSAIEATAFDQHVLGKPKIDKIRVTFGGDANAVLANLLAGAIDMAADDGVGFLQGIEAKREFPSRGGGTLLFTTDQWRATYFQFRPEMVSPAALLQLPIRQALASSLDRQALNDTIYSGEGVMTDTMLPPTVDYYQTIDRAITKYPYDLRRTEQLMTQAGFTRGADGVWASPTEGRMSFELKVNASPQYESERSIIAAGWRQAGFEVSENTLPASQTQDGQARATFPGLYSFSSGVGESAVPNFVTTAIPRPENRWTGTNRGGWANPAYDKLIDTFNSTLDRNQRIQQMAQLTKTITDELPTMSMYYDLGAFPFGAQLRGPVPVSPDATGLVAWNVTDWEIVR
ncbi:MAG: peptide/nickel transport system substrate-binding protein [Chloroflexota bacterium]|nr:peptide/nickel transport system substrate-binding protein [Chloroflexota bacterium]